MNFEDKLIKAVLEERTALIAAHGEPAVKIAALLSQGTTIAQLLAGADRNNLEEVKAKAIEHLLSLTKSMTGWLCDITNCNSANVIEIAKKIDASAERFAEEAMRRTFQVIDGGKSGKH